MPFFFFNLSCSSDDEISDIPIDDTFNEGHTTTAPMILSDVHDPSQILLIDDHLVFFASAVEWNVFSLENRIWTLGGDDIYPRENHNGMRARIIIGLRVLWIWAPG